MPDQAAERRRRALTLFAAALDREPEARERFLEEACGGDRPLRREVERLLVATGDAESWEEGLGEAAPGLLAELEHELAGSTVGTGTLVGPYRLLEILGRGGMGVVWLAERADGSFSKRVAVKLVPPWAVSKDLLRRFRDERQILAGFEHPNIARLLDGGVAEDGVPFLVMEYVEGLPIDRFCDERELGIRERLRLFLEVCDGVAAAHRRLVVHRDLKPDNVLVTADSRVKLLDFGIAKLLEAEGAGGATRTGLFPLTPQYAAPEQLEGGPITTFTDVYGLGALLYRLLAGEPPHRLEGKPPTEVLRVLREADPPAPSRVAAEPRRRKRLAGDLDAIILRALRREPADRYPSAEALADDVRRFLDGKPVVARPPSLAYRTGKLLRRRPGATAAAALALVAILVVAAGLVHQARVAERVRQRAEDVTAFFTGVLRQVDPDTVGSGEITLRELLDQSVAQLEGRLGDEPELRAEVLGVLGDAYKNLGVIEPAVSAFEETVSLRRELHGERHPATLEATLRLAWARIERCDETHVAELDGMLRRALESARAIYGPHSAEAAEVHWALGLLYRDCVVPTDPRHQAAATWLREAAAIHRELGGDTPELAQILHHLAFVSGDDAERLMREALAMLRGLFGERHLEVAESLNDLGLLLEENGKAEEGVRLVGRSLELHRELLGPDHPLTVKLINNRAGVLRDLGRHAEAEPLYREVLALRRARLPEGHRMIAFPLHGLGLVLMGQGKLEDAEAHLRAALDILRDQDPPLAAITTSSLGECLALQGRLREGRRLLEEGYRGVLDAFGPEDYWTLRVAEQRDRHAAPDAASTRVQSPAARSATPR